MRIVLGIVCGLMLANLIVFAGEAMLTAAVPAARGMPAGGDALAAFIGGLPVAVLVGVVTGWTIAGFIGSLVAARIARRGAWPGRIAGGLFLAVVVANFATVPHPAWMVAAGSLAVIAAVWLGARAGGRISRAARP